MKKLLALMLALILAAGCAGCAKQAEPDTPAESSATETAPPMNDPAPSTDAPSASGLMEGPGYATPEEAVLAYVDAMNRGDVEGMLSTFAIETFVDRVDPEIWLYHRRAADLYSMYNNIPASDSLIRSLLALNRRFIIAASLKNTYVYNAITDYTVKYVKTAEERQSLKDMFTASPLHEMAGHVEFVRWVNPVSLTKGVIAKPQVGYNFMDHLAYTGADDFTELVAELRINGRLACQPMMCIRYGNRWYNFDFSTETMNIAKINYNIYETLWIPADETEIARYEEAFTYEYPEESARWDAMQQSDMAGARWPLASLSIPDVAVCDSAAAAENNSGTAAWAEIHFTRVGGAMITVHVSPALRQVLGMATPVTRIIFAWSPDGISTSYTHYQALKKKEIAVPIIHFLGDEVEALSLDGISTEMTDTSVTITLGNGLQGVFRKPDTEPEKPAAPAPATSVTGTLEGSGFDTPEDAVLAYLDAMNRGDAGAMLATFAMETYAAHVNPMYNIVKIGMYSPSHTYQIPYSDDYGRSLIAYNRACSMASGLLNAWAFSVNGITSNIRLETGEEIRAYLDQYRNSPLASLAGNVAFTGWLDPASLMGEDMSSLADELAVSGANDVTVRVARFTANGYEGVLPMRCIRYGDRWYNDWPESRIVFRYSESAGSSQFLWLPKAEELSAILAAAGANQ